MGSVCGKPSSAVKDSKESPKQRELIRKTSELRVARAISSKRNESFSLMEKKLENGDLQIGLADKRVNGSLRMRPDFHEKRRESFEDVSNFRSMRSLPRAAEGEQVAAGWPSWLVAVAGEAIRGWLPRSADTFEKLDMVLLWSCFLIALHKSLDNVLDSGKIWSSLCAYEIEVHDYSNICRLGCIQGFF